MSEVKQEWTRNIWQFLTKLSWFLNYYTIRRQIAFGENTFPNYLMQFFSFTSIYWTEFIKKVYFLVKNIQISYFMKKHLNNSIFFYFKNWVEQINKIRF